MGANEPMTQLEPRDELKGPIWRDDFTTLDLGRWSAVQSALRSTLSNEGKKADPDKFLSDSEKAAPAFVALLNTL